MAVSKFTSASNANDFNINITSTYSTATLDREYPSGSYSIVSSVNDTSIDIYAFNSLGTLVGYTGTKAFTATGGFSKLVVIGGTAGDILGFSYKTTFTTASETAETGAAPVLLGASPTSLPNINNSLTLTGYNFASGMTVTFTGSDFVARVPKSIVVGSPNSAIVTRPDTLPTAYSPYTLTATNPGVNSPVGTNSHILSSPTISSGVSPVWVTSGTLPPAYPGISFYSTTVSATDADGGSSVTYSVTAGALPAGLTLNSSAGTITGTPTGGSQTYNFTLTATDSGGNTTAYTTSITTITTLPVTSGLAAWFTADSYNGTTWNDLSGNSRNIASSSITGTLSVANANTGSTSTYGASRTFNYVWGGSAANVLLPSMATMGIAANSAGATYTFFHVARWHDGTANVRIFTTKNVENWLSGFWGGQLGVAYHQNWLVGNGYTPYPAVSTTNGGPWLYSTDQNNLYRSNGTTKTQISGTFTSPTQISINGWTGELSTWDVAEIIFYNRTLSSGEYQSVESYLATKYGIASY
jgi:hypothetical protein